MPNNCPVCGNRDHVYRDYDDSKFGPFVLCAIHGMQVCEQPPEKAKYQGGTGQTATPILEYLDGGTK
jgi:hypothetical protein